MPGSLTGANGIGGEWNQLVSSHFEVVNADIQKLITFKGKANEALRAELAWSVSREVFGDLCKGEGQNGVNIHVTSARVLLPLSDPHC